MFDDLQHLAELRDGWIIQDRYKTGYTGGYGISYTNSLASGRIALICYL
jgi:hypothetical protein